MGKSPLLIKWGQGGEVQFQVSFLPGVLAIPKVKPVSSGPYQLIAPSSPACKQQKANRVLVDVQGEHLALGPAGPLFVALKQAQVLLGGSRRHALP